MSGFEALKKIEDGLRKSRGHPDYVRACPSPERRAGD
jgi:hypothetical protein